MPWLAASASVSVGLLASSHREAPLITETPKLDATDFYMFNSYEAGRSNFVTFVANHLPLQDSYGGPNYFSFDPEALYEIHIDNNGDSIEDLTFQFRFQNTSRNISLPIGPEGNRRTNAVPVLAVGPIGAGNIAALNLDQTYTIGLIKGPRRGAAPAPSDTGPLGLDKAMLAVTGAAPSATAAVAPTITNWGPSCFDSSPR